MLARLMISSIFAKCRQDDNNGAFVCEDLKIIIIII